MIAAQIVIATCDVAAVWLSQDTRESWRRWACIFGLLAQPAWFIETIAAKQWGIVALCALYAISWAKGFHTHWLTGRAA
jgi:hypothetical protein